MNRSGKDDAVAGSERMRADAAAAVAGYDADFRNACLNSARR